jgi:hypothetical protein
MVQSKSARSSTTIKMPAPEIFGLLPDVPGGETNLLPEALTRTDLKVWFTVPALSNPDLAEETVELIVDGTVFPEATRRWNTPIDDTDRYLELPQAWLRNNDGEHRFSYKVTLYNDVSEESFERVMTLDTQVPLLAAKNELGFPAEVLPPDNRITARYLSNHDDQVLATLPDYDEKKPGDVITWYWEDFPEGLAVVDTKTLAIDDIGKPLEVVFAGQMLRERKNGQRYATYKVRDRAGNETLLSSRETLQVDIQPPPLRKHPTVKESQNSGATGQLDTQLYGAAGITVEVPKQDDESPDITFEVCFKGYGDLGSYYAPLPIPADSSRFHIPPTAIPANIGAGREVEIRYIVNHSGSEPETSDPFKLTCKPIPTIRFRLINCPLASAGPPLQLKLSSVPEGGTGLTLDSWVYQADTQLINIWLTDATSRRHDIREAWPVTIGVNRATLPKTFLTDVPMNSTFSVHVSVSFDGGDTYVPFPSQSIQLRA